ncbi:hypothetical protein RKK42_31270 [Klebsiella pneumoniae]|nr:hypothetical protein [Klebsiella pneumoniae]
MPRPQLGFFFSKKIGASPLVGSKKNKRGMGRNIPFQKTLGDWGRTGGKAGGGGKIQGKKRGRIGPKISFLRAKPEAGWFPRSGGSQFTGLYGLETRQKLGGGENRANKELPKKLFPQNSGAGGLPGTKFYRGGVNFQKTAKGNLIQKKKSFDGLNRFYGNERYPHDRGAKPTPGGRGGKRPTGGPTKFEGGKLAGASFRKTRGTRPKTKMGEG